MGYCAEKVYMDKQGVIRWTENRKEVALFGANYSEARRGCPGT